MRFLYDRRKKTNREWKTILEAENIQALPNLQCKYHRILYIYPASNDAKNVLILYYLLKFFFYVKSLLYNSVIVWYLCNDFLQCSYRYSLDKFFI